MPTQKNETDDAAAMLRSGLVHKQIFTMAGYVTVGGKEIKNLAVGWESYGTLNAAKDNAVLVPHFYSANSHVAGRYSADDPLPGYWDSIIGPGKAIDTDRYFVLSVDSLVNMNSKDGITVTTGPSSIDPDSGTHYALRFPVVTIRDFVRVQKALLDTLGITRLHASVGVSMGALQSYEWAAAYPDMVARIVAVNGTPSQRPFAICNLESWVYPIKSDPYWNGGDYYGHIEPLAGVANAFFNVMVAAQHPDGIAANFSYKWADLRKNPLDALDNEFLVNQIFKDAALQRAAAMADANNMLYMTRANQLFVAGTPGSSVAAGLTNINARTLIIQSRTDLLFPPAQAQEHAAQLQANGTDAYYIELDSNGGHFGGITDIAKAASEIRAFLDKE